MTFFESRVPDGDNRSRQVCSACGYIAYENPQIVVGAVCYWENRILLCKRAIDPRRGFWTLPAGFLELNETTSDGARREIKEEAEAEVEIEGLMAVYNIPQISQVQLIYRARLKSTAIAAGPESTEVGLFAWVDIPWHEISFPAVRWALEHYHAGAGREPWAIATNPPEDWGNYSETAEGKLTMCEI